MLRLPSTRLRAAQRTRHRRGSMIPLMAVAIVILLIAAAFSVDTAYMQLARTEMRSAVDAAARGAGQVLANGGSDWTARQTAKDMAARHKVAGKALQLSDLDIVQGNAARQTNGVYSFTAGGWPSNAFQIVGKRTSGSLDGQINSIFGGLLGVSKFNSQQSATVVRGDRDVMLVLDTSGSMMYRLDLDMTYPLFRDGTTAPDPWFSRWGVLDQSLDTLMWTLSTTAPIEKVGLVTFDTTGLYRLPLSTNYTNINTTVSAISSAPLIGWTNMGEGLQIARDKLINSPEASSHAARTIILLTDGQPNVGPDPMTEAQACRAAKITVHTISYSNFAASTLMQAIADETGGDYYHAPTSYQLQLAFEKIGRDLPVLLTQ